LFFSPLFVSIRGIDIFATRETTYLFPPTLILIKGR
jgi:hypothetical protein